MQTMMKSALLDTHHASAHLQMEVLRVFQSLPWAASQDIAQELAERVNVLMRRNRVRVKSGKAWIEAGEL